MDALTVRTSALTTPHLSNETTHSSAVDLEFLKTATQELNNPITTIKTALTLLSSPTLKSQQRERYLQMIGQACERQSHLINDVFKLLELQIAPQSIGLAKVQLWNLVPGVVSTYQPLATEHDILLAYTVANHLPPVLAIDSHLKQVLISLLSNRIQCAESRRKAASSRIWVTANQCSDDKVALIVQDDGRGIAPSVLPQVFDSFNRNNSDGSGLSLTLVQQLLIQCGASISVSSTPGKGTAFTILLKVAAD
ncbi:MAG: HAMP domain-containing histidine kinase [Leptolyngbyaceae cyanobacterium MAG.088]|nr:HAMP domain-containing histidine kinase [Leptolyngbyaceae cyanobacterium MAG.088]